MTTLRPADARFKIAQYRGARDRAYAWYEAGEIVEAELDALVDWINGEIMALQERLAGLSGA